MNILFFTRRFYPEIGGVETHTLEVCKQLLLLGHTVTIITETTNKKNLPEKETYKGIPIYRIPISKKNHQKKKKFIIWQWLYKNQYLIKKADIIHCHDVFYWYLPFLFIYPSKPIYTTFHGYEGYPITKKAIFIRKLAEKLSWGNICIGKFIEKWYGTKATKISYGGINITKDIKSKIKKDNAKLKIIFIGRLDKDTGIMTYLKSLEWLKKKNIPFSFEAYGDGKFKKQVEKIGKVHGFVNDVEKKIQKADIIFASSYLSILQSLVTEKLIFSVYENPLKEDYLRLSPFANFIIVGNNPQKIAEKIIFYKYNPLFAKKLIQEGKRWAKKQTWGKIAEIYLQLWNK